MAHPFTNLFEYQQTEIDNAVVALCQEKIAKIAVLLNLTWDVTIEKLQALSKTVVFHGARYGDYLNWLLKYAAQFGELPTVTDDGRVVVKVQSEQDAIITIQGTGINHPEGLMVVVTGRGESTAERVNRIFKDWRPEVIQYTKEQEKIKGAPACRTIRRQAPKIGRNAPCPCGSGNKYKVCCLVPQTVDFLRDQYLPVHINPKVLTQQHAGESVGMACKFAMDALSAHQANQQ